jgi:hypothetical protein
MTTSYQSLRTTDNIISNEPHKPQNNLVPRAPSDVGTASPAVPINVTRPKPGLSSHRIVEREFDLVATLMYIKMNIKR